MIGLALASPAANDVVACGLSRRELLSSQKPRPNVGYVFGAMDAAVEERRLRLQRARREEHRLGLLGTVPPDTTRRSKREKELCAQRAHMDELRTLPAGRAAIAGRV